MEFKIGETALIAGRRHTGKTTLLRYILKNLSRWVIVDILRQYSDLGIVKNEVSDVLDLLLAGGNRVVYQPVSNLKENFQELCRRILTEVGNITIAIEEADRIANKWRPLDPSVYDLVHLGANANVGYIAITRRTANLQSDFISQSIHYFIFRMVWDRDLEALRDSLGDKINLSRTLQDYHCIYVNSDTGEYNLIRPIPYSHA